MSNVTDLTELINAPFVEASGTCEVHGDYQTTVLVVKGQPMQPECGVCMQERIRSERQAEARALATQAETKGRAARIDRIMLPPRLVDARWRDYKPPNKKSGQFLKICQSYAQDWELQRKSGANLIMTGNPGNGKTHMACVIAKQVAAENDAQPLYVTLSHMLRSIRASFNNDCEYTETQAIYKFARCDLLVVDEVGVKLSSDYDRSTLFEIVDIRYQERLPTIMISNLSIAEIERQIDERMVDRLTENGTLMIFDWESYRSQVQP